MDLTANLSLMALALLAGVALAVGFSWTRVRAAEERALATEDASVALRQQVRYRQQEAARLREMFAVLLRAYPQPVVVTGEDRIILFANRPALDLLEVTEDQAVGRVAATVIQDYETVRLLLEAARTGQPQEHTFRRAATGQTWRVSVTPFLTPPILEPSPLAPSPSGPTPEVQRLLMTIEDLTELRYLETVRTDFVAHVSHELRTPLAAVKLLTETLRSVAESDAEASRGFAERIAGEVDHMARLVTELLELSRIESGKLALRREPVDVVGLVEVALDRLRPLAEQHALQLASEVAAGLPDVDVDPARIGEVLVNLLHNAIKFTPLGGAVTVRAVSADAIGVVSADGGTTAERRCGPMVRFDVHDTGIGISEEDLPRVFERFYKVDRAHTRRTAPSPGEGAARIETGSGTGLGLAIARHLVELHGGRIWAESRPGAGTTFSFTVPAVTGDSAATDSVAGA